MEMTDQPAAVGLVERLAASASQAVLGERRALESVAIGRLRSLTIELVVTRGEVAEATAYVELFSKPLRLGRDGLR
jgi:hypothetical protein